MLIYNHAQLMPGLMSRDVGEPGLESSFWGRLPKPQDNRKIGKRGKTEESGNSLCSNECSEVCSTEKYIRRKYSKASGPARCKA